MGGLRMSLFAGLALAAALALSGCGLHPEYPRTATYAISQPVETRLAKELAPQLAAHPAQSAYSLLPTGMAALATRLTLIEAAEKTVDAQYFIFEDDLAGSLVLDRLLAAAGRGVRVRLLLDDWYQMRKSARLAWIGAQPNVELRVFNPVGGLRSCFLTRPLSILFGPPRLRKRMHNKALIVDNVAAVVGGRNIGDDYFRVREEFRDDDLDLVAKGPIVTQVSAAFDEYWNHRLAVPIQAFESPERTAARAEKTGREVEAQRTKALDSDYAKKLAVLRQPQTVAAAGAPPLWADAEFLYDRPNKILVTEKDDPAAYMIYRLKQVFLATKSEALLTSPYFVPGAHGMEWIKALRNRGVAVSVLTNSLASTDEIAVHGGYVKYREELLREGVGLYELCPAPSRASRSRAAETSLHTKCFMLDRAVSFVGSFNFDLRSAWTDTQYGFVVRNPVLTEELAGLFVKRIAPRFSYHVQLQDAGDGTSHERLVWVNEEDGKMVNHFSEPKSGLFRRFKAWLYACIVPERWL